MRLLYTVWCIFWLILIFIILYPFTFIFLQKRKWYLYAHYINRLWGKIFFFLIGIKLDIEYRYRPAPNKTYVFAANHFSYLDIAVMGVILNNYFAFIGKHDVKNMPLFGYMFRKLHIQVNRENAKSRFSSLNKGLKTLSEGRSIMIFPEGGIKTKNPPQMHPSLADGAFRMAIEKQVPLVPITLATNYKILPDKRPLRLYCLPMRAIVHQPISILGLTTQDIDMVKQKWFDTITNELQNK